MIVLEEVIRELGDRHTLMIFRKASFGLKASSKANEELGLTTKQYYSRIESLQRLGLIEKTEGQYMQTAVGSAVGTQLDSLQATLASPEYLTAISLIRKSPSFTDEERSSLTHALTGMAPPGQPSSLMVYQEFSKLATAVAYWIRRAKSEVYLASRYYDPCVTPSTVDAVSRGVNYNYLDGNPKGTDIESRLQAIVRTPPDQETAAVVKKLLAAPNFKATLGNITFSYLVVDSELCMIEVVNPLSPQDFSFALGFFNKEFASKLKELFEQTRTRYANRRQADRMLVEAPPPTHSTVR